MAQVAGEPVGEILKLATDLGGGAAETEKLGELQPDDPKTNRRASRATYVFRQSPLSRAPRPFVGPVLKGRNGSRLCENSAEFSHAGGLGLFSRSEVDQK